MKYTLLRLALWLLALILVETNAARAGLIDFSWQSNFTPNTLSSDPGSPGIIQLAVRGGDAVFGTGPNRDNYAVGMANQMGIFYMSPSTYTDRHFTMDLKLTDGPSGASDVLTFQGTVNGTILVGLNMGANQDANASFSDGQRSVTIGRDVYTLDVSGGIVWGGQDPVDNLFAKIDVAPASTTPKPSALILAGMGLPAICFTWRKNKRRLEG